MFDSGTTEILAAGLIAVGLAVGTIWYYGDTPETIRRDVQAFSAWIDENRQQLAWDQTLRGKCVRKAKRLSGRIQRELPVFVENNDDPADDWITTIAGSTFGNLLITGVLSGPCRPKSPELAD